MMRTYQGQGVTEENKAWRGLGEVISEIFHLGVNFTILSTNLLVLSIDDI